MLIKLKLGVYSYVSRLLISKDHLDSFYYDLIGSKQEFSSGFWIVYQLISILSQGNAGGESGFSVNGDIAENLKEISLFAQIKVYDAIICKGGILNIEITSKMFSYSY